MLSSRHFIVACLTSSSLIHFEFVFGYGIRECSSFILLHVFRDYVITPYGKSEFKAKSQVVLSSVLLPLEGIFKGVCCHACLVIRMTPL